MSKGTKENSSNNSYFRFLIQLWGSIPFDNTCCINFLFQLDLKVTVNDEQYIYISHNPANRYAEIDIRRLISNKMQFNTAITYDLAAKGDHNHQ